MFSITKFSSFFTEGGEPLAGRQLCGVSIFGVERGGRGIEVSVQVFPLFLSVFFFPTPSDQFSKSGYSHLYSSPLLFRLFFSLIFGERMRWGEISVVFSIPSAFRPSPRGRGGGTVRMPACPKAAPASIPYIGERHKAHLLL